MIDIIYGLCSLTACLCTHLLFQGYKRTQYRLLLWGGLCFACLTLNNVLVILDKIIFPLTDFSIPRIMTAFLGMSVLLYGLIWDTE
jgi:hypothetical protein